MTNPTYFKLIHLGLALILALGGVFSASAPVQAAAQGLSNTYTQDFNNLRSTGSGAWTNDSTLSGWYASRSQIAADDGSSGAGGMFSYGSASSIERAFGALPKKNSGGTIYKGLLLNNDTPDPISQLYVAYTGEQWRNSGGGVQTLAFSYQVSASPITNLTAGVWTDVTSLNFSAPITGGIASALNGNLAANQRRLAAQFSATIPAGSYLLLRWSDVDEQGADHGLAIDDLVVSRFDPPLAAADAYATSEDTPLVIAAPGVLANDAAQRALPLTAALVDPPAHGTLTLNSDGGFMYTPNPDWNGADHFTYTANEANLTSAPATVTLTVDPQNDAPLAGADSATTDEDALLAQPAPGVLGNDSDVDGDSLSAALVDGPAHGDLTLNADGSFSYQPDPNWNGIDSFTYAAHDALSASATVAVTLTVSPVNDAPTATADAYSLVENGSLSIPASGVLANDTDVDGDSLTAVLDSSPAHGSLTLGAEGGFSYTPDTDWNGSDSFTYHAFDGLASSDGVTVTLTIDPDNTAPYLVSPLPDQSHPARTLYSFDTSTYFGDADAGDVLTYSAQLTDGNPLPAWLSFDPASGVLSGTPPLGAVGAYPLRVTVSDGSESVADEFTLTVTDNPYRLFIPLVRR